MSRVPLDSQKPSFLHVHLSYTSHPVEEPTPILKQKSSNVSSFHMHLAQWAMGLHKFLPVTYQHGVTGARNHSVTMAGCGEELTEKGLTSMPHKVVTRATNKTPSTS